MTILYILLALLLFGVLILVHEGGHYLFARIFKVQVNEFSIGMGPKILKKRSKKTGIAYSLRALPIGGYVAMEGEDGEAQQAEQASADALDALDYPRNGTPFYTKPIWQRMLITAAGAIMNLILGLLLMTLFASLSPVYGSSTLAEIPEGSALYGSLEQGDQILRVDGDRVYSAYDLLYEISVRGGEPVTLQVKRGDEQLTFDGIRFATEIVEEREVGVADFRVYRLEKNFGNVMKISFVQTRLSMKMVTDSLWGLISGKYGIQDLSGPVGVTGAMSNAAQNDLEQAQEGTSSFSLLYLLAIITVNLGLFNLLPIPALDGGRLLFQLIELVIRRPIPQKVESLVHTVGLALLLLLMLVITCKDVIGLFG